MSSTSASKEKIKTLSWREIPGLIKDSFIGFFEEEGLLHGAALAYYTVFAIIPMLYLAVAYFGKFLGQEVMLDIIQELLHEKVGIDDVDGIMDYIKELNFERGNFFLEVSSMIALVLASSAFIVCLRQTINVFFDLEIKFTTKQKAFLSHLVFRLISLGLLAALTVVIIVFYFAQTILLSISDELFSSRIVLDWVITNVMQHGLAIFSNAVIFTMVFKYVHDGVIRWKTAITGAILTAVMLYLGQLLIKYYLFHYFFGAQSGGIAGTIFILLAWVYYSSQIIFFGAKFTMVYAKRIGEPITFKHAVKEEIKEVLAEEKDLTLVKKKKSKAESLEKEIKKEIEKEEGKEEKKD